MSDKIQTLRALARGALFPAVVLGIAASAPLVNNRFVTLVDGRILTVAWWFMVPLGTAWAIMRSKRFWAGGAIGLWSVIAFHLSMVLMLPVAERAAGLWSVDSWVSALFAVSVPWAIGMALGLAALEGRPVKHDGVMRGPQA